MRSVPFRFTVTSLLVLFAPLGEITELQAQDLPPMTPAIDREGGQGHVVTASNAAQEAPVRAQVEVLLGKRTYGDGFMTLTNVSDDPILAVRGVWEFGVRDGGFVPRGWNFGGASFIPKGGWKPGEEVTVPILAPPGFIVGEPHELHHVAVRITGVVFIDGSRWGEEGDLVYSRLEREIAEMRVIAERLREGCQRLPAQMIADQLSATQTTGGSGLYGLFPGMRYRILFRKMLLDEQGMLRSDAVDVLNRVIAALKDPFAR